MPPDHERYQRLAIDEGRTAHAEGNVAVGSVIVRDGEVIGAGHNTVQRDGDLTCHAEIMAIRDACRRLGTLELPGSTLYTTMEPCPMCLWAICTAGIDGLVLGARLGSAASPPPGDYSVERLLDLTGQTLAIVTGVLETECEALRAGVS